MPVPENEQVLLIVMNLILLSAFVGGCINYKFAVFSTGIVSASYPEYV
jgi:hypothetical protein